MAGIKTITKSNCVMRIQKQYKEWCDLAKSKSRIRDFGEKRALFISELAKLWDIGAKGAVATIRENRLLTASDKEEDIAFYADQQSMREAVMSGKDKIFLQRSCFCYSAVVVAHIYPPVTGQRQTLTCWRSAHFSLPRLLRDCRNPQLLRSFR